MNSVIWNEDSIVEFIGKALADRAREYDFENAPRRIEGLTEAALLQCIGAALNSEKIVARKEARDIARERF